MLDTIAAILACVPCPGVLATCLGGSCWRVSARPRDQWLYDGIQGPVSPNAPGGSQSGVSHDPGVPTTLGR